MEIYHPQDDELLREMRRVRRVRKQRRILWGSLITLTLAAAFGWLIFTRFFALTVCGGPGMSTALPGGSVALISRGTENVRQGDMILFETDDGWQLKRVIAVGGDRVVVNPYGKVRVNSVEVRADSFAGRSEDTGVTAHRLTVPAGEVFVQGDQLSLSVDSRFRDYGTVPLEKVTGKVCFVLWPLARFGAPQTALAEGGAAE